MAVCFADARRMAKDPNAAPCPECAAELSVTTPDKIAAAARSLVRKVNHGKRAHEYLDGLPDENGRTGHSVLNQK